MVDIAGYMTEFISNSRRIFTVSNKPDWVEYKTMLKVTGLGIVLLGLAGFAIILLFNLLRIFLGWNL